MSAMTGQPDLEWITLEQAIDEGLRLGHVLAAIGPRRVGTVYLCGYWHTVNTVTGVMVKVGHVWSRRRGRMITRAVSWEITEYSGDDVRDRNHCTSWEYGRGNKILAGPGDTRPRRER
jgi:hypothetical protein